MVTVFLTSYMCRIKRKENSFYSTCGHQLMFLLSAHLLLNCIASEPFRRAIFGPKISLFALWSRPWGVTRLLDLGGVSPWLHLLEGVE